jgi:hypothetical protein
MEAALYAWLDSLAATVEDRRELAAIGRYVRTTVQHLKLVDCRHVLQYHRACASAGATDLYHPLQDGDIYPLAYTMHITPHLFSTRGFNRSQRGGPAKGGSRKRKPEGAQVADFNGSSRSCDLPGHSSHTPAECFTRHPELRTTQKGDGKRAGPPSAKKLKAADDDKDK